MSVSRQKGTAWEVRIVEYLRTHGAPHAERRALNGAKDRGDVAGIPGVVIEAKNEKTMSLAGWVDEAEAEAVNARAELAVVWHHRRGKASPGQAYVTMTGETFAHLLAMAGYTKAWGES